jgi:hypothetical protein
LYSGWNLMGYTETTSMPISSYFESVNSGQYSSATTGTMVSVAGPLWTYYAYLGSWFRDPSWGLYPGYGFWVYNKMPYTLYLAP